MGIIEKIAEIEAEVGPHLFGCEDRFKWLTLMFRAAQMNRTQKNKATNYHIGLLKAKLAKLRQELITPSGGGGVKEEGSTNI